MIDMFTAFFVGLAFGAFGIWLIVRARLQDAELTSRIYDRIRELS